MPDLKDQIRTYYEATTEPVDVHDVVVDSGTVLVGPFPDAAQRRAMDTKTEEQVETRRRGLLVAAAAFVVVVAVGAGTALVGGDDAPGAAPVPTTSFAPDPTSTPMVADPNEHLLVFDGDSCEFATEPVLSARTWPRFVLDNQSEREMKLAVWMGPDTATEAAIPLTDYWFSSEYVHLGSTVPSAPPGGTTSVSAGLTSPGFYWIDCFVPSPTIDHEDTWRVFFVVGE